MRLDRSASTFPVAVTLIYKGEFAKEREEDRFIPCCSVILPVLGFARSMALDQELYLLNILWVAIVQIKDGHNKLPLRNAAMCLL